MSGRPRPSAPSRAHRRVHARVRHRAAWSEADLAGLDRLYRQHPKWWWHLPRIVRQQVQVGLLASELGLSHLVSAPLLAELAFDPEPDALASALKVALRTVAAAPEEPRWTTLEAVLLSFLRKEEVPANTEVEPIPIDLGEAFTPLTTWPALQEEGRQMRSCVGQPSWWRETVLHEGMAYSLQRGEERATVWLEVDPSDERLAVQDARGPKNRELDAPLRSWIDRQLTEAVQAAQEQETSRAALEAWLRPATVRPPTGYQRLEAMESLAARLSPPAALRPPPARVHPFEGALRLRGLPPAHWVRHYPLFEDPPDPAGASRAAGSGSCRWDSAQQALLFTTREGEWTLHAGLPLRMTAPPEAGTAVPFLWMDLAKEEDVPYRELPDAVHAARAQWLATLPDWLPEACSEHSALQGMDGLWLLSRLPALAPFLKRFPAVANAVVSRISDQPSRLRSLASCLEEPTPSRQLEAVLGWLEVPEAAAVAEQHDRLAVAEWSRDALVALGRVLRVSAPTPPLLDRLHRIGPGAVALLDIAQQTGLQSCLSLSLLADAGNVYVGPYQLHHLGAVFAELAAAQRRTGKRLPRLRSLSHLARVFLQRRGPPRPSGLSVLELAGPWDQPARSLEEVESLATQLGGDPFVWSTAATTGLYVFSGLPLGVPTVSWLEPAGMRGQLKLAAAHSPGDRTAPRAVRMFLEEHLRAHNQRVAALPRGWSAEDAVAAGLPASLASVSRVGLGRLDDALRSLLLLRD